MTAYDRRMVLRAMGALAAACACGINPKAWASVPTFVIPHRPFILRRELERGLAHGDSLLVIREWRGHFEHSERGTLVDGAQISCTVDAPAVLEPIAAIERERIAPGPFPAELDAEGRIVDDPAVTVGTSRTAAVRAALVVLERLGASSTEMIEAREYLGKLAEASGTIISEIPPDLFFPVVGEASERRDLALPGGVKGEVSVQLAARAGPGGLLESLDRRISTRIGEDARNSRETWHLRMT
ncbi:hypothetical protein [Qipengyuania mesophila]|uniref:hypothetical protein n=1 Tax=Qipengyuania mesophila TaxID=2867246 RepID=UPI003516A6EF